MFFYVYQITNKINNKIYIGVHKTKELNDSYMGSGKLIKRAFDKYGVENFNKEILHKCNTYEEALMIEQQIVDDSFLERKDVYNIRRGGCGGFDYINKNNLHASKYGTDNPFFGKKHTEETKKAIAEKTRQYKTGVPHSEEHKNNIAEALRGKPLTEERKRKISEATKGRTAHNKGKPAERWKCPHCGTEGGGSSNKNRYHFDKCKEKK